MLLLVLLLLLLLLLNENLCKKFIQKITLKINYRVLQISRGRLLFKIKTVFH